ncbi:MAG: helix-turn-helix transcriptional regulator [Cytophagales bacterium]|nr:helix-turn-helix transcriptional regulator [Armatimonadota bacterium]
MRRHPKNLQTGLERFVELAGVSRSHLARALKAATGQTPTAFVNELRLTRAALLPTTTGLTIIEIAADCGFAQLSHFYRLFQQRYRIAPQAYRRRAQRSLDP